MSKRKSKKLEGADADAEHASAIEPDADGTMFAVPVDAKPITIEDVYRALEDYPG